MQIHYLRISTSKKKRLFGSNGDLTGRTNGKTDGKTTGLRELNRYWIMAIKYWMIDYCKLIISGGFKWETEKFSMNN